MVLTDQRIERLITATETLEDVAANWTSWIDSGGISHPQWCIAPTETTPGLNHRSDRQTVSHHSPTKATRSEVIDLQLVQTIQRRGQPDNPTRVLLNTCTDYEHTTWYLELHQLPLIRLALAQVSRWRSREADQDDTCEY
ncbi:MULTISPECIES: hypothetical protein [Catenuloplanes]|uniref:Uncharacterized protein n=1 Tax=Catenuloplanes niger TaxID=587534 RepID=A0AAE4CYD7_9ACTN|nr:hypothetical protein [Catenuloplanes niger]MDR7327463.1 hypothetical protein [Catenuloplanes niger]